MSLRLNAPSSWTVGVPCMPPYITSVVRNQTRTRQTRQNRSQTPESLDARPVEALATTMHRIRKGYGNGKKTTSSAADKASKHQGCFSTHTNPDVVGHTHA